MLVRPEVEAIAVVAVVVAVVAAVVDGHRYVMLSPLHLLLLLTVTAMWCRIRCCCRCYKLVVADVAGVVVVTDVVLLITWRSCDRLTKLLLWLWLSSVKM